MSRRAGNDNENAFCAMAEELGFSAFPARGSRGVVDVLCFMDVNRDWKYDRVWPPLAVQIGTHRKPVARTLAELQAASRPIGSLCVVARRLAKKGRSRPWQFVTPAGKFSTLEDALRGS